MTEEWKKAINLKIESCKNTIENCQAILREEMQTKINLEKSIEEHRKQMVEALESKLKLQKMLEE